MEQPQIRISIKDRFPNHEIYRGANSDKNKWRAVYRLPNR
jgi:hypothetical protein